MRRFLSLWLLLVSSPLAAAVVLAPGDDIQKAIGANAVVELADGVHFVPKTLRIEADASGATIRARPGTHPVLSAGRPLGSLEWRTWRDGIYRAHISGPAFDSLWSSDTKLVRARYPNTGMSADSTSPERIARWKNPANGVLHAIHESRWGGIDQIILGKNADGTLSYAPPVGNNRLAPPSPELRYVENILEELDAPGEWYADFTAGWLYLKPLPDMRMETVRLVASRLENLIEIDGASNVTISGITFEHTATTFAQTTEPLLRSDWMFHRGGAVLIENSERITLENSDFTQLGGNAVVVSGHNRNVMIRGNHIYSIGASAISFVGRPAAVRSPLFEYHEQLPLDRIDRAPGPKTDDYPADSLAEDNLIHDIGLIEKQSAGIQISMAARIGAIHNSIYRAPRAGINIGDGTWGGHRIEGNDVFQTVLETGDHGAFNSWGRDRFWHPDRSEMNKRVATDRSLALLDAIAPVFITNNRFHCDHGWDIDLDDGSSNYVIERNVLLSGGLKLREGFDRVVRNNIILNNSFHPHVWFQDSGDVFEHNIVGAALQPILMQHWGKSVDFNLFPTPASLQRARAEGHDAHSLSGDPKFVAPLAGDYRVASDSPALRIGFANFPTTGFGVRSARLASIAERPSVPVLSQSDGSGAETSQELLGMTIKSVQTLGEQSAAGLPSIEGVIVQAVADGSAAARAGMQPGDVILAIAADKSGARDPMPTAADLVAGYRGRRWRGVITVEVMRNQQRQNVLISFRQAESK